MKAHFTFFLTLLLCVGYAQQNPKVREYVYDQRHQLAWLKEYVSFVGIPNVYGDSVNIHRNAVAIEKMLSARGVKAQLLHSGVKGASPVVYGEVMARGATQTLLFYAHYDGQPVNPKQWAPGLEPFTPVLLSDRLDKGGARLEFPSDSQPIDPRWRLYARGAADDKAGVFAIIAAYETLLRSGIKPQMNLKFFFEGEEEAGSINLDKIFQKYKDLLRGDLWIICDGPRHISGKKQVVFGVRGDVNLDLTVYGAKRPLHSGNYGNWAPNPSMRLVQLLASMKNNDGMVTIKGFYDDVIPLTETEKAALANVPDVEEILLADLLVGKPDGSGRSFKELLTLPSLNINGIQGGNIGSMAANVISTEATAVLDLRLVAGNDVQRQIRKMITHIQEQGYHVLDHEPTDEERKNYPLLAKVNVRKGGYNAQRTPMDLPMAQKVVKAINTTTDYAVIQVPSLGGSLPLFLFEQHLNAKPITVPIVNYDNNQHAENENVMLLYLWEGIEIMAAVMSMKN